MIQELKRKFKKSRLHPLYCKLRGWQPSEKGVTFNRNDTWAFNAANTFTGNPKWLFIYVNKYRKDIDAYWFCDSKETVEYIKSLGYKAYTFASEEGKKVQRRVGVFVVEQVKESIPTNMKNVKMLNLFHGVGCKSIERKVNFGFLNERIAKKYIRYNEFYKKNQLFLVTSPLMEEHFKTQCGIADDKVIRAGYPRCIYQRYYEKIAAFDHDIRRERGISSDAKIAAYVPTYRDGNQNKFFVTAIPDMDVLVKKLQEKNMLLIFKMHPQMEKDFQYVQMKEVYKDCPNLMFWDNTRDFYEIFDQIDLAIIDYSSIFYDMLVGGVPHFVRYLFDYEVEDNIRDLVFDLKEMTCGKICNSFEELIQVFDDYEEDDEAEKERINDLFWSYSDEKSFDKIIDQTLAFEPDVDLELPTLYSFDIFDTLISRKVLDPKGIFYYVKEAMETSGLQFPEYLIKNYPFLRNKAERNVREYYIRTMALRKDDRREITFDEIFERMAEVYELNEEQIAFLKEKELEAEYDNCIPLDQKIGMVETLVDKGETVVLISDMYLPKEFIQKMLRKVCPMLAELPLFLSSDYGVQKTTKKLFLEVYKSFEEYNFKEWKHFGDNPFADQKMPKSLNITPITHQVPAFNEYEQELIKQLNSYDSFLLAAHMARFRQGNGKLKNQYAYSYISSYFVPYVIWAVEDAIKRGMKCLYFISRDGYHLKQIADAVISERKLDIKTKYIYGSRKAWRIPSFIHEVDEEFFSGFGNLAGITSYDKLLKALNMSDEEFVHSLPGLAYVKDMERIDNTTNRAIANTLATSEEYKEHILRKAAEERKIVLEYLKQEIDCTEKNAFVEYWGRGYTQECFTRLLQEAAGEQVDVPYYYARSIYGTDGHNIRYNFTCNDTSLLFTEAIFANIPYKSVAGYHYEDGKVVPTIEPVECDMELDNAMNRYLTVFVRDYLNTPFRNEEAIRRQFYDFGLNYYRDFQEDVIFTECLGPLVDSVSLYGDKREFAPALTPEMLDYVEQGVKIGELTRSLPITLNRSDEAMIERYVYLTETVPQLKQEECIKQREEEQRIKELRSDKTENDKAQIALRQAKAIREEFQRQYDSYRNQTVDKSKIVFLVRDKHKKNAKTWTIRRLLEKQGYSLDFIERSKTYQKADIRKMAQAGHLLLECQDCLLANANIRQETKKIYLGMDTFALRHQGYKQEVKGAPVLQRELLNYQYRANYDCIPVASAEVKDSLKTVLNLDKESALMAIGTPETDVYFDEEFCSEAKKKLDELFPEAKGKKLIVIMPQYREEPGTEKNKHLDVALLHKYLGDEYAIALIHSDSMMQTKYYVPSMYWKFAKDLTDLIQIEEVMVNADVIIGDYRNALFTAALLHKPILLTADDAKDFLAEENCYYPYEAVKLGPVVTDELDVLQELQNLEQYDFTKMESFTEKYLTNCDGKASERMINYMKTNR